MGSKRPHNKSRLGCRQCKKRHIKCDQNAPCCGSCTKKGLECDYKEYAAVKQHAPLRIVLHPKSIAQQTPVPNGSQSFSVNDMLLMHHYSVHTCKTIAAVNDPAYHVFWQTRVPALSYHFPFLMHAMLSITAAHRSLFDVARHQYGKAIVTFNEATKAPPQTEEHVQAIFCYSIIVMGITWALECTNCPTHIDPVMGANDLFGIVRTASVMLQTLPPELTNVAITNHMWHIRCEPAPFPLPEHVDLAVSSLENAVLIQQELYTADETAALQDTCQHLRWLFSIVTTRPSSSLFFVRWANKLSPKYLEMLGRHEYAAMAIFTFWCAPIHHSPSPWFVGDWPRQVVLRVAERLRGTLWESAVEWSLSEVLLPSSLASTPRSC